MKRLLRSALSGAFFLLYGLLALIFAPVQLLPIWKPGAFRAVIRFFYRAFVVCARWTGLFRVDADDATRAALASLRGSIVVMNHISLIDIVVILAHLPDATAIAKAAVLRNPCLAVVARRMFIVNDGDAHKLIDTASKYLSSGVNVVIFPQGTRGGTTLHRGAAHLALSSGAPIIPVRIDYDPPALAKGQPWWDVGDHTVNISLKIRPKIAFTSPDTHANARVLTSVIADALDLGQTQEISNSPKQQFSQTPKLPAAKASTRNHAEVTGK